MSQGIQPPFASIRPDQAAVAALRHIERHGGTAIVDGFNVPTGTGLYAGPDSSVPPAITLPSTASVLIAEPVLWTTNSGQHWLATFLACGGPNLYWIDVDKVAAADKAAGSLMTSTIARALASQNSMSGVSSQHITISASGQFAWTSAQLPFTIARGQVQAT